MRSTLCPDQVELVRHGQQRQENLGPILETGEEADQKRCVDANRVRDSKPLTMMEGGKWECQLAKMITKSDVTRVAQAQKGVLRFMGFTMDSTTA